MRGSAGGILLAVALCASSALAQSLEVVTVPWRGDPNQPHQVYNGGALVLQGVARLAPGCSLTAATWDPGDGTGPVAVSFADPRALELAYTYNGANNQPFVATLNVTDSCGNQASDTFRVVVLNRTLAVDVDMAIDKGLWHLHKRMTLSSVGGVPTGYWTSASPYEQNRAAATSSSVQAFAVHGHPPTGNTAEDPYVDDVQRGLAHLPTELTSAAIGPQAYGNPDSNGNGIGLYVASNPIYVGGQVIDALVVSGTPNAIALTGGTNIIGRNYAAIVQDMLDMYAWGQSESSVYRGGWRYSFNSDSDNSAAQWWAIGGIAAERLWGLTIPQWVRDENVNYWLAYSQYRDGSTAGYDGSFGYTNPLYFAFDAGMNTTPSGLVQLVLDNVPSNDPRFTAGNAYMARNWNQLIANNRLYGLFATAKAMRLAVPPVSMLTSGSTSIDWYGNDVNAGAPINGAARQLVTSQLPDGSWDEALVWDDLATAWATVILSSTIVQPGPVAICDADPEVTAATFPVNFDGSLSYHVDPNRTIVNYEWDFEGDGIYDATGMYAVHAYPFQGNYNATLRVTDDTTPSPLVSTSSCLIQITPPPFPPDADPGGPYDFCQQAQPWLLDGTGSTDPDGTIVLYEWDFNPQPLNLSFDDAFGAVVDVTAFFATLPPGTYDVGLRVHDDVGNVNTDFTVVRVRGPNDPWCQVATLTCPPNYSDVWAGGIPVGQVDPNITGTATYTTPCTINPQLTWADISVVPNTPLNPGAPEVVITRRWTFTDGCGANLSCDQIITLLSPGGQDGALTLDLSPNHCPNEVFPSTQQVNIAFPGTWRSSATEIDPWSVLIRRADGVGSPVKLGVYLTSYAYQDVTAPYYGQNGPCDELGPDGHTDLVMRVNGRALRSRFKLGAEADGTQINVIVSAKTFTGESISLMDWLVVRR